MQIRDAIESDFDQITAIYNDVLIHSTAIYNDRPASREDRLAWWKARIDQGYPVLVAADGVHIRGFASFGDFRPWPGYRHTVENSVYVDERHHRAGIGRGLMVALIERATALNKHTMVAAIEASNSASIALHASFGFAEVGRMPEVGCKFGRWLDMVLMQKRLSSGVRP